MQARATRWKGEVPAEWLQEVEEIRNTAHLPAIDGQVEAAKFADYWMSRAGQGALKLNWHATWRNWIRNAKQTYPQSYPQGQAVGNARELPDYPKTYPQTYQQDPGYREAIRRNEERYAAAERWRLNGGMERDQAQRRQVAARATTASPSREEMRAARIALGIEQPLPQQPQRQADQTRPADNLNRGIPADRPDDLAERCGDPVPSKDPGSF